MRLCIDIGNSRIKWGWSSRKGVVEDAGNCVQPRELFVALAKHDAPLDILLADVRGGDTAASIESHIRRLSWPIPRFVATRAEFGGLRVAYSEPELLGVDRFLALVAALDARPVVVVSAGTALTVDGLAEDGVHKGGLIMPGRQAMLDGLMRAVPTLRGRGDLQKAALKPWGEDTSEAIGNGLLYAWAGGAERAIVDMRERLGDDCSLLLTGGDGLLLQRWLRLDACYDESLVLRGMTHL